MRKMTAVFGVAMAAIMLVACGGNSNNQTASESIKEETTPTPTEEPTPEPTQEAAAFDEALLDEYKKKAEEDLAIAVDSITEKANTVLDAIGDSYESYAESKNDLASFYDITKSESSKLYDELIANNLEAYKLIARMITEDKTFDWITPMTDVSETWQTTMMKYDETWEGLHSKIYEKWSLALDDDNADIEVLYDEWDVAYDAHSDSWDTLYDLHSAAWEILYDNHSAVWDGFFEEETDVDKLIKQAAEKEETGDNSEENEAEASSESTKDDGENTSVADDGIRPEFQKAMDEYLAFYEEYCAFMKSFSESDDPASLMTQHSEFIQKEIDMINAFDALGEEKMTEAEAKLYLDTQNKVKEMLLDTI